MFFKIKPRCRHLWNIDNKVGKIKNSVQMIDGNCLRESTSTIYYFKTECVKCGKTKYTANYQQLRDHNGKIWDVKKFIKEYEMSCK